MTAPDISEERRQALEIAHGLIRQAGYALMRGEEQCPVQLPIFTDPATRATVGSSLVALANINFDPPTPATGKRKKAGDTGTGHDNGRKPQ